MLPQMRWMARTLGLHVGAAALVLLVGACRGGPEPPRQEAEPDVPRLQPSEPFGLAELTLRSPEGDEVRMPSYVAADPTQRGRGLMEREALADGAGMIFLFPGDVTSAFYMYRTRIPLSIAFLGADNQVLAVLDMEPCPADDPADCERYGPGVRYRHALEVNQGFFDEIGLDESWTVGLPADLPPPR